ncbi:MAG: DUF3108 domain-containing protein [Bacteroidetes bacterium]|nr:DUF3108 domain-containing protein [Bacteroidota bacterium]
MKKLIVLSFVLFTGFSINAQSLTPAKNEAFKRGEYIRYRVFYDALLSGEVNAGEAELEVKNETKVIAGRNTYHIVGLGLTKGVFNIFFKVVDRYETYIDEEALVPWVFIRRVNEGGYKIIQDVTFNQFKNTVTTVDGKNNTTNTLIVKENMQDIISAIYYARTLDFTNAKIGQSFSIPFTLDDSIYSSKIIYEGKEIKKISMGTFNCLKFKPMVATGTVFSDPYPMTLWVTDDKNHIPLFAESEILVGSVKLELIKYSGLANPLTSKIK